MRLSTWPHELDDNPHAGSFFHFLKADVVHGVRFTNDAQLRTCIRPTFPSTTTDGHTRPLVSSPRLSMSLESRKTGLSTKPRGPKVRAGNVWTWALQPIQGCSADEEAPTRALLAWVHSDPDHSQRLKSDVYLFQAELDPHEGYVLIPVRISKTREATPLVCQVREAVAADFGVRLSAARENHKLELRGDRAGIIGLLASTLPCTPLFRIDTFLPATTELVAAAAAPGASPTEGCKPCREGGCVQGAVIDEAGAVVPGATIRAEPRSGPTEARTEQSDDAGEFFIKGVPEGSYELVVQITGFASVRSTPAFVVKPGFTFLFESPFVLKVATIQESITVSREPIQCRRGGASTKRGF